jgi:para-aminobenzoate synthetase component 1
VVVATTAHTHLAFQAAIRQWFYQQQQALQSKISVLFNSQGNADKLAVWSVAGLGCRQQLTLTDNTLMWHQADGQIEERTIEPASNNLWDTLYALQAECIQYPHAELEQLGGFTGGLAGLLTYDAAPYCDAPLQTPGKPNTRQRVTHWVECERWTVWHHPTEQLILLGDWPDDAEHQWQQVLKSSQQSLHNALPLMARVPITVLPDHWQSSLSKAAFTQGVNTLKQAIHQGECYQANLSMRLSSHTQQSPWQLFEQVSAANPSPFAGFWQTPNHTIVSNSPERLVNITNQPNGKQQVSARPIAGTRGRGQSAEDDAALGNELASNPKETAEHLMLVDLLRNDLGRVSTPGTVDVDELMVQERYSHVTHLVSNVVGELADKHDWTDVFKAVFPGGTITGCPKIRCCQWLAEVEPVARGFYTGSLAVVDARTGQMDSNILIRSIEMAATTEQDDHWQVTCHAGAGIVADSRPEAEYAECLKKASAWINLI